MGRRYAKSPLELIAEIPHHLRPRRQSTQQNKSHAPSSSSVNKHTNNKNNKQQSYHIRSDLSKPRLIRSTNNCTSSIGGSHASNNYCAHDMHKLERTVHRKPNPRTSLQKCNLVRSTHSPVHRRQHAMVWDDLISVLRIEVMEDTPTTLQSCTDDYSLEIPHTNNSSIELVIDYQSPLNNTNSIELVLVNTDNNKIPTPNVDNNSIEPTTPLKSPPKTRRMSMCFDGPSNNRGLSAIGRMVRRLSPVARRLSPPVVMRRRMSFKFGGRGSNPSGSVAQYSRSDTYISDSEDDSSLDYSDDDEDVEAAIMASVAVFSQSTKLVEDRDEEFVECAICLGSCTDSSNIGTVNGCKHSFCFKCIDEWATKKNECPLCKEKFHLVTSNSRVRWY